ncbi:MAG: hypothetical protein JWM11_2124 [Planctomycetaceae bacterium]|nr:hypothetical protein [Planctomycetaceae bacterium]
MNAHWIKQLSCLLFVLGMFCFTLPGCSTGEGRNLPLNKDAAHQACESFLAAWKSGDRSIDLEPDIIGKDEDWSAGQKLISFEFLPDERSDGSNLHIPVRLTLANAQRQQSVLDVTYIVGTYPSVTVFRN